jgi:hypothetical protein
MTRRRRPSLARAAWILLGLATSLTAQQPSGNDPASLLRADAQQRADWATQWLHSSDPLRVAWGAWLARQDRQTALTPLLLGQVKDYQLTGGSSVQAAERDRHDAMLVVLDALIGLGAVVPVKEAHKLYPEFAAQSLILLVRSPDDAQPALLEIFQHAGANWNWLAAGNVLVKTRPPGLAALLLTRFTQHMTVSVVDAGHIGGFGGTGSECGFSPRAPKAGWPGVGLYHLTQFPERMPGLTATFLVGGETTVYYWRIEPGNYDNPPDFPGACDDGNRDQYRAQYLTELVGPSFPRISLNPYPQITIEWKGEADCRQRLIAAVEEQRAEFRRVVVSLQASGRFATAAEATALQPRIEVVVRDERADRSPSLPGVLENDRTIAVRAAFTKPLD